MKTLKLFPMIIKTFLTIFIGIGYGALLYGCKKYSLKNSKPLVDILCTIMRYALLFLIVFNIVANLDSNSILLLVLFVSSYLTTVALLVYRSH